MFASIPRAMSTPMSTSKARKKYVDGLEKFMSERAVIRRDAIIDDAMSQLDDAKKQYEDGKTQYDAAKAEYDAGYAEYVQKKERYRGSA